MADCACLTGEAAALDICDDVELAAGVGYVKRLIDDAKSKHADDKLLPGMVAVYEDMHADIMRDSAEVQAMIAAYNK